MPVTLIVGTNSYISLTDAESYFTERLYSDAWNNAPADDKAKALIMATKKIDRQPITGRKAVFDQVLEFPRSIYSYNKNYLVNSYFITQEGHKYISNSQGWMTEDSVSDNVKNAVCEEALALLEYGNNKRIKLQRQGVKSFNLGSMSESYSGSTIRLLSQEAKEFLQPYIAGSVEIY